MIIQHSLDLLSQLSELEERMQELDALIESYQLPHDKEAVLFRLLSAQILRGGSSSKF